MVKVNWQVPILLHYNRGMQLSIAYIRVQIIVIKPGPGVDPAKGPGPGFHGSTRVNPGQPGLTRKN